MTVDSRLRRLLDRGFYAVELPPPFRTERFSVVRNSLTPRNGYSGATTFFDGATFRGHLRRFGVINPINYLLLSRHISQNWKDIVATNRLSSSSGARPKFPKLDAEGRAIETVSLASKRTAQRHLASSYPVILSLDINRFYGSIYTHAIPWAVLGKKEAKRQFANNTLNTHWSAQLDRFCRNCNQRQTIGIPIGPDTSRIISEMILARIDSEICANKTGVSSNQMFHNIDDYQFGVMDMGEAENAEAQFVRVLTRYELQLNDFKTDVSQGIEFSPSYFQREFDILRKQSERAFVEHFFEILYKEINARPSVNVVGYALKRFAKALAKNEERDLVREHLQRLLYAQPHQARWVFPLLLGIWQRQPVNSDVRRLLAWGVTTTARRNDVGSLLWFLYAAIFLRVSLGKKVCSAAVGISNELVDLVLLHGRAEGCFSLNMQVIRARYRPLSLTSAAWLPIYEAERKGWDGSPAFTKIGSPKDPGALYADLAANDVQFYVTDRRYFQVEAFDGWGLRQTDFDPELARGFFADFLDDFDFYGEDENYE